MVRLALPGIVQNHPGQHRLLQSDKKNGLQDQCGHHGAQRHSARGDRRESEGSRRGVHGNGDLRRGSHQYHRSVRTSNSKITKRAIKKTLCSLTWSSKKKGSGDL